MIEASNIKCNEAVNRIPVGGSESWLVQTAVYPSSQSAGIFIMGFAADLYNLIFSVTSI